jgi:hypothetical protein
MPLARARLLLRIGLIMLGLGAATIAITFLTSPTDDLPESRELTAFVAFVIGGIGLFLAYIGHRTLRLASPANRIAKWTVPPDEWQRYVAACTMRVTMPGTFPNIVSLDQPVPAGGIEVLALKRGFRVGDAFHELGSLNAEILDMRVVDSPADMFEFNVTYTVGRYSTVQHGVRIPIASNAKQLANEVEDYWVKKEPLQTMPVEELRARARSHALLALAGLLAFLGTITMFVYINPPGWAAIAPISTFGVGVYGFAQWIKTRNRLWRMNSLRT